ncbi:MAG: CoA transferase, partial [Rubricoccaceae bacterium]|nr:CoA transferase [Rubricoccaceae bacterium]
QSGPRRDWPAIDNIVQATSGMMSLGGDAEGPPVRVGFPIVDTLTGQTAALAILAALFRRERTGQGEYLDIAMFDATLAFMTSAVVPYLVSGRALERTGNTGYSGQPTSAVFRARDGRYLSLGVVQQRQFEQLARDLDREKWLEDERFADPDKRLTNAQAMQAELNAVFAERDAEEWEARLSAAGIPCGLVRSIEDAVSLAGFGQRGLRIPVTIPGLPSKEQVEVLGTGILFGDGDQTSVEPPPSLGEHTEQVIDWLSQLE